MDACEKLVTQVDAQILEGIRQIARSEGRGLQALADEALADLIEKKRQSHPRARVLAAYQTSYEQFASLYKKLAE